VVLGPTKIFSPNILRLNLNKIILKIIYFLSLRISLRKKLKTKIHHELTVIKESEFLKIILNRDEFLKIKSLDNRKYSQISEAKFPEETYDCCPIPLNFSCQSNNFRNSLQFISVLCVSLRKHFPRAEYLST